MGTGVRTENLLQAARILETNHFGPEMNPEVLYINHSGPLVNSLPINKSPGQKEEVRPGSGNFIPAL